MINLIVLVILAILPTIIIATYVFKLDKHKEPTSILITLFSLGIISALGVIALSCGLEGLFPFFTKDMSNMNIIELILKTFIEVALIEELCKWFVVYFVGYNNKQFDETYDVLIYSIFVALGFATFENLFYVLENNTIQVAIQRAILSIPGHTSYAIFMSYYLCIAKINRLKNNKRKEKINIIKSIVVPTLFHGIFDFCLFTEKQIFIIVFYLFVIILFIMAFQKLKDLYKTNASLLNIKRVCSKCNTTFYGNICPNCNTRQD